MPSSDNLPPELWRDILALAVAYPFAYDAYWNSSPDVALWSGWNESRTRRETGPGSALMETKLALVRVCRSWRGMANELLYEHIFIPKNKTKGSGGPRRSYDKAMTLLVRALEGSVRALRPGQKDGIDLRDGYGWWTKRVDIPLDLFQDKHIPLVLRIFYCLSNLQILYVIPCKGTHPPGLRQIATLCSTRFSHSLRRVSWAVKGGNEVAYIDSMTCLPNLPLTSLSLDILQPAIMSHKPMWPTTPSAFASVITLSLILGSEIGLLPFNWQFPSLRHLRLSRFKVEDALAAEVFLIFNGGSLTSLSINGDIPQRYLARLIVHAPRIETLVLGFGPSLCARRDQTPFGLTFSMGGSPVRLGVLKYLGLADPTGKVETKHLERLVNGLFDVDWRRHYPRLSVIRIMRDVGCPLDDSGEEQGVCAETIEMCEENGIRLENRRGGLFAV